MAVFNAVTTITIATVFIPLTGMAQVTIFTVIPVVRVFTVLVVALENMRERAGAEKFPSLFKKRS